MASFDEDNDNLMDDEGIINWVSYKDLSVVNDRGVNNMNEFKDLLFVGKTRREARYIIVRTTIMKTTKY